MDACDQLEQRRLTRAVLAHQAKGGPFWYLEAHTVVTDPENPALKWNLDFKWDCTTERWKYMYSLHWTLFNIFQSDSFGTDTGTPDCGDELFGMTGVYGYQVTVG
jgi:hypothetical protein